MVLLLDKHHPFLSQLYIPTHSMLPKGFGDSSRWLKGPLCSHLFPLLLQAVALASVRAHDELTAVGMQEPRSPLQLCSLEWLLRAWLFAVWAGSPFFCSACACETVSPSALT